MKPNNLIQITFLSILTLYFSQGIIYAKGSVIGTIFFALIILISLYYFSIINFSKKKKLFFVKVWNTFLILNILNFIFRGSITNPNHFSMIKGVLIVSFVFYPFYYFTRNNKLNYSYLIYFTLLNIPLTIYQYYFDVAQTLSNRRSDSVDVVSNVGYFFAGFILFLHYFKNKLLKYTSLIILIFFTVQSSKRGALIVALLGALIILFDEFYSVIKSKSISKFLGISILIVLAVFNIYNYIIENVYLLERFSMIEEGGLSGRDRIFKAVYNGYINSENIYNLIFGYGFGASIAFTNGSFAHNDWLEILINLGLLGVFTYALLFIFLIKYFFTNIDKQNKIILLHVIICWFFITIFSMYFNITSGVYQSMILGILIGSIEYRKTIKNII